MSRAGSLKGWETRRARQAEREAEFQRRSEASKRGWDTRRLHEAERREEIREPVRRRRGREYEQDYEWIEEPIDEVEGDT